jgi:hypothetical protein
VCIVKSFMSHARSSLKRKLTLIIKISISNKSCIRSLHELCLHLFPALNKSSRKMGLPQSHTGTCEKIFQGHAVWVFDPKYCPFSTARISNESPKQIFHKSYSHSLLNSLFRQKMGLQGQNMATMCGCTAWYLEWSFDQSRAQLNAVLSCLDVFVRPRNRRSSPSHCDALFVAASWRVPCRGKDMRKKKKA